ncbi:MAG: N-acetylmuramoyl-L-alanine amidase [Selenomonas sp.]|uniref:peptidoglycan recognition protein family protein n=1 Tax=Selenomonas sp. TaxID=2053611 RepID=UPI0025FD7914|nr:N-acetylmuramoyl-L-alanine amidase [Selenomonas sp.]MCR5758141.1 N-acetylmuramoyl-L-alanine amidase [Selenomonas sp.]
MKRRDFLKNMILLSTGVVLLPQLWTAETAEAAWNADGGAGDTDDRDSRLGIPIKETYLEFSSLQNRDTTDAIVIHHVGNTNRDVSAAEIDGWHKNNGWAGIGYHFVIRKDGTIERGRPMDTVGAHCYEHNWHTVGVNIVGDFESNEPEPEQLDSGARLVAALCRHYGITPDRQHIVGHRDLNSTLCPGQLLYDKLPRFVTMTRKYY